MYLKSKQKVYTRITDLKNKNKKKNIHFYERLDKKKKYKIRNI